MIGGVVLAHQWLVAERGAEVVLRELMRLFPDAPIACLVKSDDFNPPWLAGRTIIQSPLSKLPGAARYYREMLALHPWAIANLKLPDDCEFVFSTDAAMIKGLSLPPGIQHACYCHSPPRYLWDQMENYCRRGGPISSARDWAFKLSAILCRSFDKTSSSNVDQFIANSAFVSKRIRSIYERDSDVIFPPVEIGDFTPTEEHVDYYLIVSQLVPYKRIDLAVEACSRLDKRLVVIGEGPERKRLESIRGPSVSIVGRLARSDVTNALENCRAFLYPQVEDFGITAVEAQAAGKPVIAYRAGGALESIVDGETGLFFDEQSTESLMDAILRFEAMDHAWTRDCRENAERFAPNRFRSEVKSFLLRHYPETFSDTTWPL